MACSAKRQREQEELSVHNDSARDNKVHILQDFFLSQLLS
jgi:hypothetical protein